MVAGSSCFWLLLVTIWLCFCTQHSAHTLHTASTLCTPTYLQPLLYLQHSVVVNTPLNTNQSPHSSPPSSLREAYTALKLVCWINTLEQRLFSAPYESQVRVCVCMDVCAKRRFLSTSSLYLRVWHTPLIGSLTYLYDTTFWRQ